MRIDWATKDGLQALPSPPKKINQKNGAILRITWKIKREKEEEKDEGDYFGFIPSP